MIPGHAACLAALPSGRSDHLSRQLTSWILIRVTDGSNLYALRIDSNRLCRDERSDRPLGTAAKHLTTSPDLQKEIEPVQRVNSSQ